MLYCMLEAHQQAWQLCLAYCMLGAHQQAWQLCLAHGSYASLDVLIGSYASLGSYALHGAEVLLNEIHQPYVCMQAHAYI